MCLPRPEHASKRPLSLTLDTGSLLCWPMSRLWMTHASPSKLIIRCLLLRKQANCCKLWAKLLVNMNDGKTQCFSTEHEKATQTRKPFNRQSKEDRKANCMSTKTAKSGRRVSRYKNVGTNRSRTQNPRDDAEAKANVPPFGSLRVQKIRAFRDTSVSLIPGCTPHPPPERRFTTCERGCAGD